MANLIIQDTFDPYYSGRDEDAATRTKPRQPSKKQPARSSEGEILLPEEAPVPPGEVHRQRRIVSH